MPFTEYIPSNGLTDYINAWWIRKTDHSAKTSGRRVYADGCADIIANTGDSVALFNPLARLDQSLPLHPGHMYLGGTMTAYGVVSTRPGCILTGIRFRPGGFFALYGTPMEEAVDGIIEFPDRELFSLMVKEEGLAARLDAHYLAKVHFLTDTHSQSKKAVTGHNFIAIYQSIYRSKGQLTVEELSRDHHVSNRTMERIFKENVGISPKEFIKIVRFQKVLRRLRQIRPSEALSDVSEESLLRIAFELGYYDHAHLTNEFKRYAGIRPSELSHFYKTGIADGLYF
jgi:AraC-like DNA-binding protein